MTDIDRNELIDMKISAILNEAEQRIFNQLDELHKRGIHDNDVIGYLRAQGEHDLVERYIEWGDLVDPDGEDTTSYDAPIPDPITDPSYQVLREQTARTETFGQ